ncbi:MAG TPA: penicillin-binding protein 1A [Caulobacteraceae bacterium]|jgi:penicillin-binding protein 1A
MTPLAIGAFSLVALAGFALAIYTAWLFHDMPDAGELADYRPPTATRVYAWDATLIGEFSKERRIYAPYDQIPPQLAAAFLAAEDRNFFVHHGVDVQGLSRAMGRNVVNAARGRRLEGGSTITQQVAKNVALTSEATLGRKLKEAILARRLEQTLSKERILELYLNEIWLGYRSYGVAAAAYNYFGKPLNQLTLGEMAYLAALPKGPDNYHPIRRKAQAIARRDWILDEMASLGWVTRAQAEAAKREDLRVQKAPSRARYKDADYFVEEVRDVALRSLPQLREGGYYMRTTLDPKLQSLARQSLMNGLEAYDRRHGWRGAWGKTQLAPGWERQVRAISPPAERREWRAAIVETTGGAVRVRTVEGGAGPLASEDLAWAKAGKGLNEGDLVWVEPTDGGAFRLRQTPQVNGALVVVEPHSGRTLALVGGYSFSLSKFNRATQAKRQPGSAIKPFVYATALENGFTPARTVLDARITLVGHNGQDWSPENYNKRYYGALPLRRGLELSRNTMTVRLAQMIGMRRISDMIVRAGIADRMDPVLAMALGAGETTPFRLTGAYSAFLNGGRRVEPHLIEEIQDREGKVIYKADKRECPRCRAAFSGQAPPLIGPAGEQIMNPVTAYQITSMLEGVVQRGTAASASSLGYPLGGKTGTTNEYRSAWFVGFSPDMVVGVFIGFDDNRSLGDGETGTSAALPVFIEFMREALQGRPKTPFLPPKEAKFALVRGIREAFRPGTEPVAQVYAVSNRSSGGGGAVTAKPRGPIPYSQAWGGPPSAPAATPGR